MTVDQLEPTREALISGGLGAVPLFGPDLASAYFNMAHPGKASAKDTLTTTGMGLGSQFLGAGAGALLGHALNPGGGLGRHEALGALLGASGAGALSMWLRSKYKDDQDEHSEAQRERHDLHTPRWSPVTNIVSPAGSVSLLRQYYPNMSKTELLARAAPMVAGSALPIIGRPVSGLAGHFIVTEPMRHALQKQSSSTPLRTMTSAAPSKQSIILQLLKSADLAGAARVVNSTMPWAPGIAAGNVIRENAPSVGDWVNVMKSLVPPLPLAEAAGKRLGNMLAPKPVISQSPWEAVGGSGPPPLPPPLKSLGGPGPGPLSFESKPTAAKTKSAVAAQPTIVLEKLARARNGAMILFTASVMTKGAASVMDQLLQQYNGLDQDTRYALGGAAVGGIGGGVHGLLSGHLMRDTALGLGAGALGGYGYSRLQGQPHYTDGPNDATPRIGIDAHMGGSLLRPDAPKGELQGALDSARTPGLSNSALHDIRGPVPQLRHGLGDMQEGQPWLPNASMSAEIPEANGSPHGSASDYDSQAIPGSQPAYVARAGELLQALEAMKQQEQGMGGHNTD